MSSAAQSTRKEAFCIPHSFPCFWQAKACSSASIARLKILNRRTVDVLAARLYFYYSYSHELTNSLAEIRGWVVAKGCKSIGLPPFFIFPSVSGFLGLGMKYINNRSSETLFFISLPVASVIHLHRSILRKQWVLYLLLKARRVGISLAFWCPYFNETLWLC